MAQKSKWVESMVCGNAVPLSNPRHVVQYLRDHVADGLANELRGLNEDNAVAALRHIEYRLADALQLVRLCQCAQSEEEAGDGDDAG